MGHWSRRMRRGVGIALVIVMVLVMPELAAARSGRDRLRRVCTELEQLQEMVQQNQQGAQPGGEPFLPLDVAGSVAGAATATGNAGLERLGRALGEVLEAPVSNVTSSDDERAQYFEYYALVVGSLDVIAKACDAAGFASKPLNPEPSRRMRTSGDVGRQIESLACGGAHLWQLPAAGVGSGLGPVHVRGLIDDRCSGVQLVGRLDAKPASLALVDDDHAVGQRSFPSWVRVSVDDDRSLFVIPPDEPVATPVDAWIDLRASCLIHRDPLGSDLCTYFVLGPEHAPRRVVKRVERTLDEIDLVDVEPVAGNGLPNLQVVPASSPGSASEPCTTPGLEVTRTIEIRHTAGVRNVGVAASPAEFDVLFQGHVTHIELLRGLEPQEEIKVSSGAVSGETVTVDPNGAISESDENDNALVVPLERETETLVCR